MALEEFRKRAILVVFLFAASGVLEGLALVAIIPMLQGAVPARDSGMVGRLIRHLDLSSTQVAWFGLALFVLLGLLSAIGKYMAEVQGIRLMHRLEHFMRARMTVALIDMDWSTFLSMRIGDISVTALSEGTRTGSGALNLLKGIGSIMVAVVFILLAAIISFTLTALTLAFGLVAGLAFKQISRRGEGNMRALSRTATHIGNQVNDVFGNLKFFRSTGQATEARLTTEESYEEYRRVASRVYSYSAIMRALFEMGGVLFVGTILGVVLLSSQALSSGSLVFLAVFYRLAPRLFSVQDFLHAAKIERPWFLQWRERLEFATSHARQAVRTGSATFDSHVEFRDVSFRYPSSERPVLDQFNWRLNKGECVAVVGSSGSGKTTMLDLLTGLLNPVSGRIEVDDAALDEQSVESWQSHIGLVLQDSPLFHTSVLANIVGNVDAADREKALRCAELANAREFIEALPEGLDTVVGERGARLSGGQRQRIALARALYRDPWLLILDEATSSLDSASEEAIQRSLEQLKGACTMVLVAHRLKTVQMADRILVLEEGRVSEEGDWKHLLSQQGGLFSDMAARQGLHWDATAGLPAG
jgi:ABC-type multidrug transport system fused ATPase/permease subunit